MIVFDITTRSSFDHVRDWQKEIENNVEEGVLLYLVGNFADCDKDRKVSREEALALCQELNLHNYIETSAYTGANINSLFETLTKHLFVENEANINEFVSLSTDCLLCLNLEVKRRWREWWWCSDQTGDGDERGDQADACQKERLLLTHSID